MGGPEISTYGYTHSYRWRKSKLNDEVLEQLKEVLSVYSYDYVIPDINDGVDPDKVELAALIGQPYSILML